MKTSFSTFIKIGLLSVFLFALFAMPVLADLAPPFPDVSGTHKNALAISILKNLGVVSGDGKTGLFKPERVLNRAEFAKMIVELRDWEFENITYSPVFPDLQDGQWYTRYILKAHAMGVLKGTGAGRIEAGREVLLAEALAMTLRAYDVAIPTPTKSQKWYEPIMKMAREQYVLDEATAEAIKEGHVNGKILTPFNGGVPRAEAAQILSNAHTRFGSGYTPDISYSVTLTSSAFSEGGTIPVKYSCDGPDLSPPLRIETNAPDVKSFALIVDDPDAPNGTWIHWVLWNIPGEVGVTEIAENTLPTGVTQGRTSFGDQKYGGPCPPPGENHRYIFKVYALDKMLDLPAANNASALQNAILLNAKILGETTLMGRYQALSG